MLIMVKDEFANKLSKLDNTSKTVAAAADLMVLRWRFAKDLVAMWESRIHASKDKDLLNLIYVANDALQKGRMKRRAVLIKQFEEVLHGCFVHALDGGQSNLKTKIVRVVKIWRSRNILGNEKLQHLESLLGIVEDVKKSEMNKSSLSSDSNSANVESDGEEKEKFSVDLDQIELIPEATDVMEAIDNAKSSSLEGDFLKEDVLALQEKRNKYEQYRRKHNKSEETKRSVKKERVTIDLEEALSTAKEWQKYLKTSKYQRKKIVKLLTKIWTTALESEDAKYEREDAEQTNRIEALSRIRNIHAGIESKRLQLADEKKPRSIEEEENKREEVQAKRIRQLADQEASAKRARVMAMANSYIVQTSRPMPKYGAPASRPSFEGGGEHRRQWAANAQKHRPPPPSYHSSKGNANPIGNYGGRGVGGRSEPRNAPMAHGRGRGRSATLPAWMSKKTT